MVEPQPTALTTWLHPPNCLKEYFISLYTFASSLFLKFFQNIYMTTFKYFFVNGQKFCTQQNLTISHVIKYFNYNTSLLVLEYNNLICNNKNWDRIVIQNNDKIEIVTIVGGG
jgi:sulfur carrier protein